MKPFYALAPLALILAGCSGNGDSGESYPYTVIECGQSNHTTITEPGREVITSAHRFREVYGVTDLNNQDDVPDVDFDTKQVVALHAGTKANPGHGLRVDHVTKADNALTVHYTAIEPDSSGDCAYPTVVVYPYCFISMAQSDLPVTYERSAEEGSC